MKVERFPAEVIQSENGERTEIKPKERLELAPGDKAELVMGTKELESGEISIKVTRAGPIKRWLVTLWAILSGKS